MTKNTVVDDARCGLYPVTEQNMEQWVVENIGVPEFGWDYETLYAGLCPAIREYAEKSTPHIASKLCRRILLSQGAHNEPFLKVISASHRLEIAASAYEDIVFGYRYHDRATLTEKYGETVAGILTTSLLSMAYNNYLYLNPLEMNDAACVEMFDYCARAATKMHYFVGMQLAWMKDMTTRPYFDSATNYALHGPIGYSYSTSVMLTASALGFTMDVRRVLDALAEKTSHVMAIVDDLEGLVGLSGKVNGEDFRVKKTTPLTAACARCLNVGIGALPNLDVLRSSECLQGPAEEVLCTAYVYLAGVRSIIHESGHLGNSVVYTDFFDEIESRLDCVADRLRATW